MIAIFVSSLALVFISITMLFRANDLRWRPGTVWHIRRVGFVLAGFAPWAIIYVDWTTKGTQLNVYEVAMRVGMAFVLFTTPNLPPYWKWLMGKEDDHADQR